MEQKTRPSLLFTLRACSPQYRTLRSANVEAAAVAAMDADALQVIINTLGLDRSDKADETAAISSAASTPSIEGHSNTALPLSIPLPNAAASSGIVSDDMAPTNSNTQSDADYTAEDAEAHKRLTEVRAMERESAGSKLRNASRNRQLLVDWAETSGQLKLKVGIIV